MSPAPKPPNPPAFTLSLDFETVDLEGWDMVNTYGNAYVMLEDGRRYRIHLWTYGSLAGYVETSRETGDYLSGLYQIPPDLLVQEMSRECITQAITDLLRKGDLERVLTARVLLDKPK